MGELAVNGEADPEGLATYKTVETVYKALLDEASKAAFFAPFISKLPKWVGEVLGTTAEVVSATYHAWASQLAATCLGKYKTNYPWSACWMKIKMFGFSAGPIEWHIFVYVSEEFCYREEGPDSPYCLCPKGARDNPWIVWKGGS